MAWKLVQGVPDNFYPESPNNNGVFDPQLSLKFVLPQTEPNALHVEAGEESDAALQAVAAEWKATSEHCARRRRLEAESAAATRRIDELKGKAAGLRRELDLAEYAGKSVDKLEAQLDQVGRETAALADRVGRLARLIEQTRREGAAELRALLQAKRVEERARVEAELAKTTTDLAAAAESLAGRWCALSEAARRLQHAAFVDSFVQDAAK